MTVNPQQRTVVGGNPYLVLNNHGQHQRFELATAEHILGRDPQRADLAVPQDWRVLSGCQATLRRVGEDYHIYDGDGQNPSTNGLFIGQRRITPQEGHLLQHEIELKIGQNSRNWVLLRYFNPFSSTAMVAAAVEQRSISLANRSVELGRDASATLRLNAPIVSRRHATIEPDGRGDYVLQDYSTNGVFVDGVRVQGSARLQEGAIVRIGPFKLVRQGDELRVLDRGNQIRLDACDLVRQVRDRNNQTRRLLNQISFAVEPGQFVALVGGSGAGKSTLMRTLLGIDPTTAGEVYLNGENLRSNFDLYRTQIGYVPQDDIVHRQLTVGEVLSYAARLRLPPDTENEQIEQAVQKTLDEIEMAGRDPLRVIQLSGGQRKRVSIGVELLADPKLFFLDEPTSGLDPGLDRKMMQLLRKLADAGRTVVLVTHATGNIRLCDRILFLGRGGNLCYFGPPAEAPEFFNVEPDNFAEIYNQLEEGDTAVEDWKQRFLNSDCYQRHVASHLSAITQPMQTASPLSKNRGISPLQQLSLLTQRCVQLLQRDPLNLSLALLTAPLGILLIMLAVGNQNPLVFGEQPDPTLAPLALRVLFVFTCAALWVGLSSTLQEIVKEAAIYQRERLVNLSLLAYVGSKCLTFLGLALIQTVPIALVILLGFKAPASELIPWPLGLFVTILLTLFASTSLGLMVSAAVKNSSQANSALPLLLLPQIVFSGVLFNMEGTGRVLSWLMLSRWSVGAYGTLVDVNAMVPEAVEFPGMEPLPQPFEPTPVYDPTWENLLLNWVLLALHALVYLAVTAGLQKRKDIL